MHLNIRHNADQRQEVHLGCHLKVDDSSHQSITHTVTLLFFPLTVHFLAASQHKQCTHSMEGRKLYKLCLVSDQNPQNYLG